MRVWSQWFWVVVEGKTIFEVGKRLGFVEERTEWPDAKTLWSEHIATDKKHWGKPFVIRGAAKNWPIMSTIADDETMLATWGNETFDIVETELKETRTAAQKKMKIAKFLKNYKEKGWYSVATFPKAMQKHIPLPKFFHCGNLDSKMHGAVLWMSGGGTKSVIHNDGQDGLNCQLDGVKHWILWSPKYEKKIQSKKLGWVNAEEDKEFKKAYGSFAGKVDVDNVDLEKYPGWDDLEWYELWMNPGDCLFNPSTWFHAVQGEPGRSQSALVWWFRPKYNPKSCDAAQPYPGNTSLAECVWGHEGEPRSKPTKCRPRKEQIAAAASSMTLPEVEAKLAEAVAAEDFLEAHRLKTQRDALRAAGSKKAGAAGRSDL
mmetsp:Transcript_13911/g.34092  ORF Transcript_13911/g.34092 Transcript_13911/m.34092 type:complete len:373 (-) Transcript_13911:45-1163(-)